MLGFKLGLRSLIGIGLVGLDLCLAGGSEAVAAQTDPDAPGPAGLACSIRVMEQPGALRLEAVVRASKAVAGRYVFGVMKQSSTGTSQNSQSGDFSVKAGGEQVVTSVVLDASARGHYSAKLSLDWKQGRNSCQAP
jgi:hypothetical protein